MGLSWLYNNQDFTEDLINEYYGFVYRITNNTTGKQYIGKKFFYSSKTKQVKGKKKRFKISSDWQTYYGSNEELCPAGKAYIKRRQAAGEKSSAYLSGRAVKVCKGQMKG